MSNPYTSPGNRPLEQLKVAELREELKKRGLSLKGVKKDLIERLDEVVRKEQGGPLTSASEGVEEEQKDVHGVHEPEGEHGTTHSAGHPHYHGPSESVQDGDSLLYLNDSENPLQDSGLIVNNASPYVGASDATPVFMEPLKDAEKLNTEFAAGDKCKDELPLTINVNSASSSGLPESRNAEAGDVIRLDNCVQESNAGFPGDDKQIVEVVASTLEPDDEQAGGNEANLPGKDANDTDLPEENLQASGDDANDTGLPEEILQASGNDVAMPEADSQAGGNGGLLAAPELFKDINSTMSMEDTLSIHKGSPNRDDSTIGDTLTLAQELEVVEATCQGEMAILSEPVKDVAIASVSYDLLTTADASLPVSSGVVIANDSFVQVAEVLEKNALSFVDVASSVLEAVKDGAGKVESAEDTILKVENVEGKKHVDSLESGEALIPPSADGESPVMPPGLATLEVLQDPILPEVQQNTEVPESLQDSVMHEVVQDVVVQEVAQDVEMVEALENPSMKMEVSEVVLQTELPAVSIDTLDRRVGVKSENVESLHAGNSNQLNEAARAMVDEEKLNVKPEPVGSEPRAEGRVVPVENVKAERRDVKEDLPKSARSYDRSRPRESEYERSRHELGRGSAYGSDRNRGEGRSGRVFREERRKDPRERDLKPGEEEFPDRSSHKRRDYDRDAKQQEPAKRVRRWNSGNELVVETAKPLTTGSVKEIMSPELKKEGFAAAPPLLTPRLSGPSRPTPATAKTSSEANGDQRAVPPPARAPTSSLRVERFVRPFTLKAVKDLLSEYGQCVDFWMDQIKTHCYVMYSKVDEAVAARDGVYNKQWPPSFGNLLVAEFVDPSEVKIRSDGSFEKMNAPAATTPRGGSNQPPQGLLPGAYHGHSNALAFAPPLRERQGMQVVPMKEPEPPIPTLDDLFRKTKAKPHIYYLPLTDEQVMEKLASARNKEQQQQVRSNLPGRG